MMVQRAWPAWKDSKKKATWLILQVPGMARGVLDDCITIPRRGR